MLSTLSKSLQLAITIYSLASPALSKAVFCHYMVGGLDGTTTHAQEDINQAKSEGCDAFALNLGNPTEPWAEDTVKQLFESAANANFKLFFSLDLAACTNVDDFHPYLKSYLGNRAYYKAGSDNLPFLSTFHSGSLGPSGWSNFLNTYGSKIHFVPNFDDVPSYYSNPVDFFSQYKDVVDGVFSWETAWPEESGSHQNVSCESDKAVQRAAKADKKDYMLGLSTFQFKALRGGHYYRVGDINLPMRMEQILAMEPQPEFVEVLTWNDAGECHYIGNIWPETAPPEYANQRKLPHDGWQSLIASFAEAYKTGKRDPKAMLPALGSRKPAEGAVWYRTILKEASCASDPAGKPPGWEAAGNAVNYAFVVKDDLVRGHKIRVTSGGKVIQTKEVHEGLNYDTVQGMQTGEQKCELLDGAGKVMLTAIGKEEVEAESSGVCNWNYQVAPLEATASYTA